MIKIMASTDLKKGATSVRTRQTRKFKRMERLQKLFDATTPTAIKRRASSKKSAVTKR